MNKQDKFIKLMEEFKGSSLLKYIGDQELPDGKKSKLYNAKKNHGELTKNSTYMDSSLKKRGYIRGHDLTGGLSDGMTLEDISNLHSVSYDDIVKQALKGVEVESEHTPNKSLAKKIAMDHLVEDPRYYDKLENIEESESPCWDGYERVPNTKKHEKGSCRKKKTKKKQVTEAKKNSQCTKVTQKTSSSRKDKKWMKCEKQPDGSIKRIHWGDPNAKVTGKSGNTKRKKSFRARHNCSSAKKGSPQAAACRDWN